MPAINLHSSRAQPSLCDVLIIGAGPSGLMIGQALARLGIQVKIVERRVPGSQYGHADGLQPRTLEIWKSYGMLEQILSKGACMHAMVAYETSSDKTGIVRSRPSENIVVQSRFQYEVTASIRDIEGTLLKNAEAAGVQIVQPSWPISLEVAEDDVCHGLSTEHLVKVTIEHVERPCAYHIEEPKTLHTLHPSCVPKIPPRTEIIQAKYLIGADGAHSWVRKMAGIEMEGEQTEDTWGVVDVLADTDFPDYRFKCVIQAMSGTIIIIPREGDKIRIYVQMSSTEGIERNAQGHIDKSRLQEEKIRQQILAKIESILRPYKIEFRHVFWSTIFSTAQKVAASFSYKDRIFIIGDACHTHSPKAGQGANVSMGDAHNLAWKLAYVLKGWAAPSLLQSYEVERRSHALDLIAFDKEISNSLEASEASHYQRLLHRRNLFTSGIGIRYSSSLLTIQAPDPVSNIVPGERLPSCPITRLADWHTVDLQDLLVSDGRFKLLIFPGDIMLDKSISLLREYGEELYEAFRAQGLEDWTELFSRLALHTVVRNNKEDIIWKDIPSRIVQSWRCCFCTGGDTGNAYNKFDIWTGATVLIRPDGYVSFVSAVTREDARQVITFLYGL